MTYEDQFASAFENDVTSVNVKMNKKASVDEARNIDKYYEKYSILLNQTWTDGKIYKKVTIENHGSGQTGSRIRNAVTGERYPFLVGSVYEDLFFKVSESSGRGGRKDPLMLFYDTPEQYENHHFTFVSQPVKELWYERSLNARKELKI